MLFRPVAALAVAALLAACAAPTDSNSPVTRRDDPVYRTGSNIPIRDKAPLTAEEKAAQKEAAERYMNQVRTTGAGATRQ